MTVTKVKNDIIIRSNNYKEITKVIDKMGDDWKILSVVADENIYQVTLTRVK